MARGVADGVMPSTTQDVISKKFADWMNLGEIAAMDLFYRANLIALT
jgi:hypothetical protein